MPPTTMWWRIPRDDGMLYRRRGRSEDLVVPAVTKGTDAAHDLAVVAVALEDIPDEVLEQLKIATLEAPRT